MYYTIGLKLAGRVQYVLGIMANTLCEAKQEWARLTGHLDNMWDDKTQTYFGWPIVRTKIKPLQRKTNINPFNY
jgi:hypothetical protein